MTSYKGKYPIESFGPELMAFLTQSGREKVVLKFDGPRGRSAAHNFVRRVYALRKRLLQENHPNYKFAVRAKLVAAMGDKAVEHGAPPSWAGDENGKLGAVVVGQPYDSEFRNVLRDARIEVKDPEQEAIPPPLQAEPEGRRFSNFLDDLEDILPSTPVPPKEEK